MVSMVFMSVLSFSITDDPDGNIAIDETNIFYKMYNRMFGDNGGFSDGLLYILVGVVVIALMMSIFKTLENPSPISIITNIVSFAIIIIVAFQGKKLLYFAGVDMDLNLIKNALIGIGI